MADVHVSSREKKKTANHPRDRLLSIQHDVNEYLRPLFQQHPEVTIVANERCGNWYALPFEPKAYCRFKSTDGHVHLFSLKRLNLSFLKTLHNCTTTECCWVVDASNKKELPDSFSRTIPIWACVLNRVSEWYRRDLGISALFRKEDLQLFLPSWDWIPKEEQAKMQAVIDTRVQELYQCKAIVDILGFLTLMDKPLRPFWITPLHSELPTPEQIQNYHAVVCCNASNVNLGGNNNRIVWRTDDQFWYTPGAADDEESWARFMTPRQFWSHQPEFSSGWTHLETDEWMDQIVRKSPSTNIPEEQCFDWIGTLNIAIGTRRAGRPPNCWEHFDAVLNVTSTEYEEMSDSLKENNEMFYLQLPVEEGKRDKQELEKWLALGILFCAHHARQQRKVLIHCAQGRDRSVAVAMAVVQLFCHPEYPLTWNWKVLEATVENLLALKPEKGVEDEQHVSMRLSRSGLPTSLGPILFDSMGQQHLLNSVRKQLRKEEVAPLASKDSLRIMLHLIRQDREKAEPSRTTMQKLNRFFMSDVYKKAKS